MRFARYTGSSQAAVAIPLLKELTYCSLLSGAYRLGRSLWSKPALIGQLLAWKPTYGFSHEI